MPPRSGAAVPSGRRASEYSPFIITISKFACVLLWFPMSSLDLFWALTNTLQLSNDDLTFFLYLPLYPLLSSLMLRYKFPMSSFHLRRAISLLTHDKKKCTHHIFFLFDKIKSNQTRTKPSEPQSDWPFFLWKQPARPKSLTPGVHSIIQVPLGDWATLGRGRAKGTEIPCRRMRSGSYVKAMGDLEDSEDSEGSPKPSPKSAARRHSYLKATQHSLSEQQQPPAPPRK